MQTNQNIVVFQPRKSFKSTFIEILINTLEATAEITLLFIIIDMILGYLHVELELDVFAIEGIWDIVDTFIVVFIVNVIFRKLITTKVDVQNKILKLRTISRLSLVTKKNIMEIERIIVTTNTRLLGNVAIVCNGRKIGTSINDYTKFVTLLQELNPSIEVEYKE